MNKKKKAKKKIKFIFTQDIDPYRSQMLVCVGKTLKETKQFIKKNFKKDWIEPSITFLEEREHIFSEVNNKEMLGYSAFDNKKFYAVILQEYVDEWWYWECLLHELSHILDWMMEHKMMKDEGEARAYLHEFLFNQIRRKIQGVQKI